MGLIIDTSIITSAKRGKINFEKCSNYKDTYISAITITELLVEINRADAEARRIKRSALSNI